jgi:hypothetical protein
LVFQTPIVGILFKIAIYFCNSINTAHPFGVPRSRGKRGDAPKPPEGGTPNGGLEDAPLNQHGASKKVSF